MRINIVAITYRDAYFFQKYGPAVRDLQILLTLSELDNVTISLLDRPVSLYERALGKIFRPSTFSEYDIEVYDTTSFDLLGPLRRRLWWNKAIPCFLDGMLPKLKDDGAINVFLDFMPIGIPSAKSLEGWIYWYDYIDNFTKHNRFSAIERRFVEDKYCFVKDHAQLLTFVSSECLANVCFSGTVSAERRVLTNKLFIDRVGAKQYPRVDGYGEPKFDFGFIGFVTDKLDIEFIARLSVGYSVAIYGDFYDRKVKAKLAGLANVFLLGGFRYQNLPKICRSFKVGLLPYREDRSHDGSPLKLYEYLRYLRPVISSINYEITDDTYIKNYQLNELTDEDFNKLLDLSGSEEIGLLLKEDDFLITPLAQIVQDVRNGEL